MADERPLADWTGDSKLEGRGSRFAPPDSLVKRTDGAACWRRVQIRKRRIGMKYEKPVVQRFGTLREITLGGGPLNGGDATNVYHRS